MSFQRSRESIRAESLNGIDPRGVYPHEDGGEDDTQW